MLSNKLSEISTVNIFTSILNFTSKSSASLMISIHFTIYENVNFIIYEVIELRLNTSKIKSAKALLSEESDLNKRLMNEKFSLNKRMHIEEILSSSSVSS